MNILCFTCLDWINKVYLPTNRSRLWDAHAYVTEQLRQLEQQYNFKIIFHNRCSGLYMWINLKKVSSRDEVKCSWADLSGAAWAQFLCLP